MTSRKRGLSKREIEKIEKVENTLAMINETLWGPRSHEPSGLVHTVSENTKFRKAATSWLWLMVFITTGLVVERILNLVS